MPQQPLTVNGTALLADLSGALIWPDRRLLVIADLHFEKGSGFARRGQLLPPYDTAATLERLEELIRRVSPATVICLGDSFHDRNAAERMAPADAERLRRLVGASDWIWIQGNHDPEPPTEWGGRALGEVVLGPLAFRHEATPGSVGEISGHHHPAAALRVRGRRIRGRCFAHDGKRLILPAFGAFTGGLNVLDPSFAALLERPFTVQLLGRDRLYPFPSDRLEPDPGSRSRPF